MVKTYSKSLRKKKLKMSICSDDKYSECFKSSSLDKSFDPFISNIMPEKQTIKIKKLKFNCPLNNSKNSDQILNSQSYIVSHQDDEWNLFLNSFSHDSVEIQKDSLLGFSDIIDVNMESR